MGYDESDGDVLVVTKKRILGVLLLLITATSVGVIFGDSEAKLSITKTSSTFSLNESNVFVTKAVEYGYLYRGSTRLSPLLVNVSSRESDGLFVVERESLFDGGVVLLETYAFDPASEDVLLFPKNRKVRVLGGSGLTYRYEVRKLSYSGSALKGLSSPQRFGRITVEWDEPATSTSLSSLGTLQVRYLVDADDWKKEMRTFDPVLEPSKEEEVGGLQVEKRVPISLLDGKEAHYEGVTLSNSSGFLVESLSEVPCVWGTPFEDVKRCGGVVVFENWDKTEGVSSVFALDADFDMKVDNIRYSFSNSSIIGKYEFELPDGNLSGREGRFFSNFEAMPDSIDFSKPFAIKVDFETPKASSPSFNLSINKGTKRITIDPTAACGSIGWNDGTPYTLGADLSCAGTGLNVVNSSVILDCEGYNITYNAQLENAHDHFGVNITGANVTVKGCKIFDLFGDTNSDSFSIVNNSVFIFNVSAIQKSPSRVLLITGSNNTRISDLNGTSLNSTNTGDRLIEIRRSINVTLNKINVSRNTAGVILVRDGSDNLFLNDSVITGSGRALHLAFGANNTVVYNSVFDGNQIKGTDVIVITDGAYNPVLLNNLIRSTSTGIEIEDNSSINTNLTLIFNNSFGNLEWVGENYKANGSVFVGGTSFFGLDWNIRIGKWVVQGNESAFSRTNITNSTVNVTVQGLNFSTITGIYWVDYNDQDYGNITASALKEDCTISGKCFIQSYTNGILKFNVTNFTGSFTPFGNQPANYTLTTCTSLGANYGTPYLLANNVSAAGTCFNIVNHSVILDCQGYNATYQTGSTGTFYGVNISNYWNVTVKGCWIEMATTGGTSSHGFFISGNDNTLYNTTIRTTHKGEGIRLNYANRTNITLVTVNDYAPVFTFAAMALNVRGGQNNTVFKSKFKTSFATDNVIQIGTDNPNGNRFIQNNITSTTNAVVPIAILHANDTLFDSNEILSTGNAVAVGADGGIILNNLFLNNNITGSTTVEITESVYSPLKQNFMIYNNSNGQVNWTGTTYTRDLEVSVAAGNSLGLWRTIYLPSRIASINVSAMSTTNITNSTVEITLFGFNFTNVTSIVYVPYIDLDPDNVTTSLLREDCTSKGWCQILNYSQSNGKLIFNATNFNGTFTASGTYPSYCGTLGNNTGVPYRLENNVSSTTTCFNIVNNSVILDCQGYNATYQTGGSGLFYGVNNTGFSNVTVKNCWIQMGTATGTYSSSGIHISGGSNNTIYNNTIVVTGVGDAVFLRSGARYNNISNNILGQLLGSVGQAVSLNDAQNNTFFKNRMVMTIAGADVIFFTGGKPTGNKFIENNVSSYVNSLSTVSSNGIFVNDTLFESNTFYYGGDRNIYLAGAAFYNTLFLNNNFTARNTATAAVIFENFYNTINKENFLVYNNTLGSVNWTGKTFTQDVKFTITAGRTFGNDNNLYIRNGSISINITTFSKGNITNSSAEFKMYTLNWSNVTNILYVPYVDTDAINVTLSTLAEDCTGKGWCQILSYSGGNLVFNATNFNGTFVANGTQPEATLNAFIHNPRPPSKYTSANESFQAYFNATVGSVTYNAVNASWYVNGTLFNESLNVANGTFTAITYARYGLFNTSGVYNITLYVQASETTIFENWTLVINNTLPNVTFTLGPTINAISFVPNLTCCFNSTTRKLTQHFVNASNQTVIIPLFNVTWDNTTAPAKVVISTNFSAPINFSLSCSNASDRSDFYINLTTTNKTIVSNITRSSGVWCWANYINASTLWRHQIRIAFTELRF